MAKAKRSSYAKVISPADVQEELDTLNRVLISVIRGARQDADLTQTQIGDWLAISEDVVSNIEALKRPAFFAQSLLWARLSGMEYDELFKSFMFSYRQVRSRKE